MVTIKTATVDATFVDGGVLPGSAPGLGLEVDEAVLGVPVASWD